MIVVILGLLISCLIILLLIWLILIMPSKMCEVAESKGYNAKEKHIFALCFWFGIFGFLYVIALPDLKMRKLMIEISKQLSKKETDNNIDMKI